MAGIMGTIVQNCQSPLKALPLELTTWNHDNINLLILSQDLTSNPHYCLLFSSYHVGSENLLLDQQITL